jgi:hypothetical protein
MLRFWHFTLSPSVLPRILHIRILSSETFQTIATQTVTKLPTHFHSSWRIQFDLHAPTTCQSRAAQKILAAGFTAHRLAHTRKEKPQDSTNCHLIFSEPDLIPDLFVSGLATFCRMPVWFSYDLNFSRLSGGSTVEAITACENALNLYSLRRFDD